MNVRRVLLKVCAGAVLAVVVVCAWLWMSLPATVKLARMTYPDIVTAYGPPNALLPGKFAAWESTLGPFRAAVFVPLDGLHRQAAVSSARKALFLYVGTGDVQIVACESP